jgi:hypothetical protein
MLAMEQTLCLSCCAVSGFIWKDSHTAGKYVSRRGNSPRFSSHPPREKHQSRNLRPLPNNAAQKPSCQLNEVEAWSRYCLVNGKDKGNSMNSRICALTLVLIALNSTLALGDDFKVTFGVIGPANANSTRVNDYELRVVSDGKVWHKWIKENPEAPDMAVFASHLQQALKMGTFKFQDLDQLSDQLSLGSYDDLVRFSKSGAYKKIMSQRLKTYEASFEVAGTRDSGAYNYMMYVDGPEGRWGKFIYNDSYDINFTMFATKLAHALNNGDLKYSDLDKIGENILSAYYFDHLWLKEVKRLKLFRTIMNQTLDKYSATFEVAEDEPVDQTRSSRVLNYRLRVDGPKGYWSAILKYDFSDLDFYQFAEQIAKALNEKRITMDDVYKFGKSAYYLTDQNIGDFKKSKFYLKVTKKTCRSVTNKSRTAL